MTAPLAIPFVVGQWVRGPRFYGRAAQLAEILDGPRDSLWLLGTRRMGKTSMLKQLELLATAEPERGYFPIFWDFQGAADPEELHLDFQDALLDAEERLDGVGVAIEEVEADDLFTSLGRLRRRLRPTGRRLLLLCDEVEELIELDRKEPALLRKLRRALQSSAGVRSVLASTIRLWALSDQRGDTSPFLHGFTPPVYLPTLTDDEALALAGQTQLDPAERPAIEAEAAAAICRRCDNHPYLVQLVCKRYLETGDLEEAVEQVAGDPMVSYFFSVDFEMLSETERHILRTIARRSTADSASIAAGPAGGDGSIGGDLLRLAGLGFIRRDDDRRFALRNDFFRRWLSELGDDATVAAPGPAPPPPVIEGRYELRELAGEGATGLVYSAWDRLLEVQVALKILRPELTGRPDALERFRRETLLSRDLGHPNILRVYDLGEADGRTYMIMQWVDGPTLDRTIAERAPLPAAEVLSIGVRLAAALEAAHGRGILHRDVKPQNVLMRDGTEPLITDFGLARLLGRPGITGTGMFVGTPNYVSPEQADLRPLDARSDIYSLGVVLYELATGRRPFQGDGLVETLEQHRREPPPDPRTLVPSLSPELAAVLLRCLEKSPDARPATAAELRVELERLAAQPPPAS